MLLRFTKMHSLGVDFMVIDLVGQHAYVQPRLIKEWSQRKTGIGFERLITVEVPTRPDVDFRCRVFNSAGDEVLPAVADLRCVVRFAIDKRLTLKQRLQLETSQDRFTAQLRNDGLIEVEVAAIHISPNAQQQRIMLLQQNHAIWLSEQQLTVEQLHRQWTDVFREHALRVSLLTLTSHSSASHSRWCLQRLHLCDQIEAASAAALFAMSQARLGSPATISTAHGPLLVSWPDANAPAVISASAERVYEGKIRV